jgi:hypothetical protein
MSQSEVIKILRNSKEPLSIGQILIKMNCSISDNNAERRRISHALHCLLKYREVKAIEIDRHEARKYNCKRRINLYYI